MRHVVYTYSKDGEVILANIEEDETVKLDVNGQVARSGSTLRKGDEEKV